MRRQILLLVTVLAVSGGSALAETWYVDPSGSGEAWTIEEAMEGCGQGDTVLVAQGVYSIDAPIHPPECSADPLYILGESGASLTIIDCSASGDGFTLGSGFYIVKGFTVRGASGAGILIDLAFSGEIVVQNCVLKENAACGIDVLFSTSTINIIRNVIHSNGKGIHTFDSSGIYIVGNTISGHLGASGAGISIVDCNPVTNIIQNNIVVDNTYMINGTAIPMLFENNDIYNNVNNQNVYVGIDGNFSLDPEFCSVVPRSDGNFSLQSDSPCAPGNHPLGIQCGLVGARMVGCSTVSTGSASWGTLKSLRGK